KEILGLTSVVVLMLIALTFAVYLILFFFRRSNEEIFNNQKLLDDQKKPKISYFIDKGLLKNALLNLGTLGSLILAFIGIHFLLSTYEILYSTRGFVFGAGFTDVKITIWLYRILAVGFGVSAIIF